MSSKSLILAALKKKFEGVDEKVLNRIAKNLANTSEVHSEEEATTAIEDVTLQNVIDSYADSRAADATHTSVSNYEKKYGLKDGKKSNGTEDVSHENDNSDNGDDDGAKGDEKGGKKNPTASGADSEVLAMLKEMKASNEKMASEILALKSEKITGDRMSTLKEALKDAPKEYIEKVGKLTKHMDIKGMSEEDFNDLITDFQDGYEAGDGGDGATGTQQRVGPGVSQQARNIMGAPKAGAGPSGAQAKVNPFVQARADANKAAVGGQAIIGVPQNQTQNQ